MNIWEVFDEIMKEKNLVPMFIVGFLFAPVFLIILYFYPDLFIRIDVMKLILLSFFSMIPLIWINYELMGKFIRKTEKKPEIIKTFKIVIITAFIILIALIKAYILNRTFHEFVIFVLEMEIITFLVILIANIHFFNKDLSKGLKIKEKIKRFKDYVRDF